MDQIAVDFRALEQAEESLRAAVDHIDVELDGLERLVDQLVTNWTGPAAEAYRAAQHEWDHAVAGMREAVRELHQLIVTAHGNHGDAVRTNVGIWAV